MADPKDRTKRTLDPKACDFRIVEDKLIKYKGSGGDVIIPEGVTSIGNRAFSDCRSLTSVIIPEGVTSIGNRAFSDCRSLTSVIIPEGVTSIGYGAFSGCSSLTSVIIPKGVTSIENETFEHCRSLTSVIIPEGVTSIGDDAFSGCSSLTGITIPEGVKSIGDAAFFCCNSLVDQDGFIVIRGILHYYSGPGGEVRIPEGVTRIGSCVFCVCDTITGVIIPETVTSIGSFAFFMCTNLTSVTIPKGVTNIGKVAFSVHSGTREVIIYTPYVASFFNDLKEQVDRDRYENIRYYAINYEPEELILIYLGGPLSDLPEECRKSAAGGFMYALEKGITEVDQWREEYLEYIRNNVNLFIKEAEYEKHILLFLMKEKLLDEEATMRFLKEYKYYSFNEVKAALEKYYQEQFGTGSPEDQ